MTKDKPTDFKDIKKEMMLSNDSVYRPADEERGIPDTCSVIHGYAEKRIKQMLKNRIEVLKEEKEKYIKQSSELMRHPQKDDEYIQNMIKTSNSEIHDKRIQIIECERLLVSLE